MTGFIRKVLSVFVLCGGGVLAAGQATPTASRVADVQAGATFSYANGDYNPPALLKPDSTLYGYGFYADVDLDHHIGVEADFHQLSGPDAIVYERTYEVGARYFRNYGRVKPYVKAMYGRGVFNFPGFTSTNQEVVAANLAYNIFTGGGGVDVRLTPGINLRLVDYEYQRWGSFPPHGLTPQVLSFGVAYHFHGGLFAR